MALHQQPALLIVCEKHMPCALLFCMHDTSSPYWHRLILTTCQLGISPHDIIHTATLTSHTSFHHAMWYLNLDISVTCMSESTPRLDKSSYHHSYDIEMAIRMLTLLSAHLLIPTHLHLNISAPFLFAHQSDRTSLPRHVAALPYSVHGIARWPAQCAKPHSVCGQHLGMNDIRAQPCDTRTAPCAHGHCIC